MIKRILFCISLLFFINGFCQSELYVLHSEVDSYSDSYRQYWYSLSYRQVKHNASVDNVNIKLDYFDFFNDDPSCDCGGPCGQYADKCSGTEYHDVSGLVWEYYSNTGWKEIPNLKNKDKR
ncbi:hypothetical protein ACQY1Q_01990 [Tenacibaculum sp. TC6]|uniref:hypothetical protein n=1 Tax=Tenacibaculum sp. TC6 TaxID=3423223 RepID=UPI003D364F17